MTPTDVATIADELEPRSRDGIDVTAALEAVVADDQHRESRNADRVGAGRSPLACGPQLSKEFPVHGGGLFRRRIGAVSAVSEVDLEVSEGTTLGLVGESGCGKTTLGRLVVGLEKPSAGHILLRGQPVGLARSEQSRTHRVGIQLMFQDSYASLDPRMRVRPILREPLEIHRVGTSRDRDARVDELLEAVGLPAAQPSDTHTNSRAASASASASPEPWRCSPP